MDIYTDLPTALRVQVYLRVYTSIIAIDGIFTCTCCVTADVPTVSLIVEFSLIDTLICNKVENRIYLNFSVSEQNYQV